MSVRCASFAGGWRKENNSFHKKDWSEFTIMSKTIATRCARAHLSCLLLKNAVEMTFISSGLMR